MNLEEIEAHADLLLDRLAATDSAGQVRDICFRLDGLKSAAQIKSTVAFRKEREAELTRMQRYAPSLVPPPSLITYPAAPAAAAPTKPAVDRLHELVSHLNELAKEDLLQADDEVEVWKANKWKASAKAYVDAADKLEEVLREGEL